MPAAMAAAWCAPPGLRSPQQSRGRSPNWSRTRTPAATGLDLAVPTVALLADDAAEPVAEEPQPRQHSDAAAIAAPTAKGPLRRLRTPRSTATSRAPDLTAQPE